MAIIMYKTLIAENFPSINQNFYCLLDKRKKADPETVSKLLGEERN